MGSGNKTPPKLSIWSWLDQTRCAGHSPRHSHEHNCTQSIFVTRPTNRHAQTDSQSRLQTEWQSMRVQTFVWTNEPACFLSVPLSAHIVIFVVMFCLCIIQINHNWHCRYFLLIQHHVIKSIWFPSPSNLLVFLSYFFLSPNYSHCKSVHPSFLQASVLQADRWVCCSDRASQEWSRPRL